MRGSVVLRRGTQTSNQKSFTFFKGFGRLAMYSRPFGVSRFVTFWKDARSWSCSQRSFTLSDDANSRPSGASRCKVCCRYSRARSLSPLAGNGITAASHLPSGRSGRQVISRFSTPSFLARAESARKASRKLQTTWASGFFLAISAAACAPALETATIRSPRISSATSRKDCSMGRSGFFQPGNLSSASARRAAFFSR